MKIAYSYARFSTLDQSTGDSERRQAKQAEDYAKEHGYNLVSLGVDRGLSAYSGKNISGGILGDFIRQVESGKIPKGSVLLLESPDRFSRQQFSDAWPHFQKILKGGVEIHFTFIREVIKPDHSFVDLIKIGVDVDRSHGESKTKVIRHGELWREKKRNAKVVTSVLPAWLKTEKISKGVFAPITVISDRARIIRKIFKLAGLGMGSVSICQKLNKDGDKPFGSGDSWNPFYVKKILKNIAVLGHYQPMSRRKDGPKIKDGEVRENYYPSVITQTEWNAVRESVRLRTRNGIKCGRIGNATNLFTGLLFDVTPSVNRHMVYRGKSGRAKNDYLVTAFRPGEKLNSVPYLAFESHVLSFLNETDWRVICDVGQDTESTKSIQQAIDANLAGMARISRRIGLNKETLNAEDLDANTFRRCQKQLAEDESTVIDAERDLERLQADMEAAKGMFEPLQRVDDLKKAIYDLKTDPDGRLKLKTELARRISKIAVSFKAGEKESWVESVAFEFTVHFVNGARGEVTVMRDGTVVKGVKCNLRVTLTPTVYQEAHKSKKPKA